MGDNVEHQCMSVCRSIFALYLPDDEGMFGPILLEGAIQLTEIDEMLGICVVQINVHIHVNDNNYIYPNNNNTHKFTWLGFPNCSMSIKTMTHLEHDNGSGWRSW